MEMKMNALNPSYDQVQIGDQYMGGNSGTFTSGFMYISTVWQLMKLGPALVTPTVLLLFVLNLLVVLW
jgi:hypothetical protein